LGRHRKGSHRAPVEKASASDIRKMTQEELERKRAELQADQDDMDFPPKSGDLDQ
jgi:ribosomal protein L29